MDFLLNKAFLQKEIQTAPAFVDWDWEGWEQPLAIPVSVQTQPSPSLARSAAVARKGGKAAHGPRVSGLGVATDRWHLSSGPGL